MSRFLSWCKKWLKRAGIALAVSLAVFLCTRVGKPVIFSIPGDCACTDYSSLVEGHALFNPWRDRSPELAGEAVLQAASKGVCSPNVGQRERMDICSTKAMSYKELQWSLRNREDSKGVVMLFYAFGTGADLHAVDSGSEGALTLEKRQGNWAVTKWDVVW